MTFIDFYESETELYGRFCYWMSITFHLITVIFFEYKKEIK